MYECEAITVYLIFYWHVRDTQVLFVNIHTFHKKCQISTLKVSQKGQVSTLQVSKHCQSSTLKVSKKCKVSTLKVSKSVRLVH